MIWVINNNCNHEKNNKLCTRWPCSQTVLVSMEKHSGVVDANTKNMLTTIELVYTQTVQTWPQFTTNCIIFTDKSAIRHLYLFILEGSWWSWCLSLAIMGREAGSPWRGRRSIARKHRDTQDKQTSLYTLTAKAIQSDQLTLQSCFLDHRREPKYLHKT